MKRITVFSIVLATIIPATAVTLSAIDNSASLDFGNISEMNRQYIGNSDFGKSLDISDKFPIIADKDQIANDALTGEKRLEASEPEASPQKDALDKVLGKDRFKNLGWWGQISAKKAPVMALPATSSKQLASFSPENRVKILKEVEGEEVDGNNLWYQIDGGAHPGAYILSANVLPIKQPELPINFKMPEGIADNEYWVDVDLTNKVLTLFRYDEPVFSTYVAIGRPGNPTLPGIHRVWLKLEKTRMRGGPPTVPYRYDLKNVPYVMYYFGSYALHGTYWHDKFGTRQSAGCTNLTKGDAKFLFEKLGPDLGDGEHSIRSSPDNPGTVVYNHY